MNKNIGSGRSGLGNSGIEIGDPEKFESNLQSSIVIRQFLANRPDYHDLPEDAEEEKLSELSDAAMCITDKETEKSEEGAVIQEFDDFNNVIFRFALINKKLSLKFLDWREIAQVGLNPNNIFDKLIIEPIRWYRILSNDYSPEDEREFNRWLNADEERRRRIKEVYDLWEDSNFQKIVKNLENKKIIPKYEVGADILSLLSAKLNRMSFLVQWINQDKFGFKTRAAMAIFIVSSIALFFEYFTYNHTIFTKTYSTDIGAYQRIVLIDGSTININTNTHLSVIYTDTLREIVLNRGEAYFDVKKDGRPFIVNSDTGSVRVLGTAFEVQITKGEMVVSVERGRVAVKPPVKSEWSVELNPGEQVHINYHNVGSVRLRSPNRSVADWRDGWLEFTNTPLPTVIDELNKYYQGHIIYYDDMSAISVTGRYNVKRVKEAVKLIAQTKKVKYAIQNNNIVLSL